MSEDLSPDAILAARDATIRQLQFAREYSITLLDAVPDEHWFTIPDGQASCVAWQVGHMALKRGLKKMKLR